MCHTVIPISRGWNSGTILILQHIHSTGSPRNENLNLLVWSWIYFYIVPNKNCMKNVLVRTSFTGLGSEDQCSSWGLVQYENISAISIRVVDTSGTGSAYPSGVFFWWGTCCSVVFCRSLFVLLFYFFLSLHCLIFFDLRLLITLFISSNLCYDQSICI